MEINVDVARAVDERYQGEGLGGVEDRQHGSFSVVADVDFGLVFSVP